MKTKVFIMALTSIICATAVFAQTEKGVSITYRLSCQQHQEIKKKSQVLCILDIIGCNSRFYNRDFERAQEITDSMQQRGHNAYEIRAEKKKEGLTGLGESTSVLKNFPDKGKVTVTEQVVETLLYEENMPKFSWKLTNKDTTILGYKCFEATTTYRGRTWRAFYTPDIPISEGPWKLCGLPGLILFAADSLNQFCYEGVGMTNDVKHPIALKTKKYRKCSAKEMANMLSLLSKDLDEFFYRLTGAKPQHFDASGKPTKLDTSFTACLKEEFGK